MNEKEFANKYPKLFSKIAAYKRAQKQAMEKQAILNRLREIFKRTARTIVPKQAPSPKAITHKFENLDGVIDQAASDEKIKWLEARLKEDAAESLRERRNVIAPGLDEPYKPKPKPKNRRDATSGDK